MNKKHNQLLEKEYSEKLKIKVQLDKSINNKIDERGLKNFSRIRDYMYGMSHFFDRGIVKAHLDFEPISSLIAQKKRFSLIYGRGPSGPLHLGHLGLFRLLLDLQKLGADIIIPFTNDEFFIDGKIRSLEEEEKRT